MKKTFEDICNGSNEDFNKLMGIQSTMIFMKQMVDQYKLSEETLKTIVERVMVSKGPLDIPTMQTEAVEIFNKY